MKNMCFLWRSLSEAGTVKARCCAKRVGASLEPSVLTAPYDRNPKKRALCAKTGGTAERCHFRPSIRTKWLYFFIGGIT